MMKALRKTIPSVVKRTANSQGVPIKNFFSAMLVFFSRFIKIMPNFSLVGSFGFFQKNLLLFFAQILAFDLLISGLYPGFLFSYLGFFSYWLFGRLANNSIKKQALLLPLASFFFFLFSNFGVWWYWYPRNLAGLTTCYTLALPFYRNTLLGDLFFGAVIIGVSLLIKKLPQKVTRSQASYV